MPLYKVGPPRRHNCDRDVLPHPWDFTPGTVYICDVCQAPFSNSGPMGAWRRLTKREQRRLLDDYTLTLMANGRKKGKR